MHLQFLKHFGFPNKISVFLGHLNKFLFRGPMYCLGEAIIHSKKIGKRLQKKDSIFAQSIISHYFRGPCIGSSWWALARGCPHFLNFWKSLKNEASGSKNKNFASSTFEECPICYNCSFMIENKGFMLGSWCRVDGNPFSEDRGKRVWSVILSFSM